MSVSSEQEYEPLEPGGAVDSIGVRLLTELRAAPLRQRIILPIYLVISSFGGLYGGYALTSAYSNWITWSISFLILEPIGVASLLALLTMIFPDSALSTMLARALNRAKLAVILVGLAVAGFFAWAAIVVATEFWRTS